MLLADAGGVTGAVVLLLAVALLSVLVCRREQARRAVNCMPVKVRTLHAVLACPRGRCRALLLAVGEAEGVR